MHFLAAFAVLVVGAGLAAAEPKPESTATQTKQCKRVVIGKGLERKVVCEIEQEIVVGQQAPKPSVIIVNKGGREVVGRPKSGDRLNGLSRRRR
ncbi:MAG: hypothetical protein H0T46_35845 [Deltaproteobacteria bacterium]|nr:hypothetical protein [Deltaproteobacteria bacterium]